MDWERFRKIFDAKNGRLVAAGKKKITEGVFVRLSRGTIVRTTWWSMMNGRRRLTDEAKVYAAAALDMRPEEIWPSFGQPEAAKNVMARLPQAERVELLEIMLLYAEANRLQKRRVRRAVGMAVDEEDRDAVTSAVAG